MTPKVGDLVRVYTPYEGEDPDHPINWVEGGVEVNTELEMILENGFWFLHTHDTDMGNVYYIVE